MNDTPTEERHAFQATVMICIILALLAWGLSSAQATHARWPSNRQLQRCDGLTMMKNTRLKRWCLYWSPKLP